VNETVFKSDKDFGYHVSLVDGREYAEGHSLFGLNATDTEVTALQKILDKYFDTTSLDGIASFADYKLDFSISFLDTICLIMNEKIAETNAQFRELEDQLSDISHRMTPSLSGQQFTTEQKVELFDMQRDLLSKRRNVKDALTVMRVFADNIEQVRNFVLGMNRRQYSAKSQMFSDDVNYHYGAKDTSDAKNPTKVSVHVQ